MDATVNQSLLQVTKQGPSITGAELDFERLRRTFEDRRWLVLPRFFDQPLLDLIQEKLQGAEYRTVERDTGVELRPVDCTPYLAAELLLNTPKLFRVIEKITGCARIACFSGRIYRRPPTGEYFSRWHTDISDRGRLIALTINLNREPYSGGALQIRSAVTRELLCEAPNPNYGDALIFPIDPRLEHRIGDVQGKTPKTALAGWFFSQIDPHSLFGRGTIQSA